MPQPVAYLPYAKIRPRLRIKIMYTTCRFLNTGPQRHFILNRGEIWAKTWGQNESENYRVKSSKLNIIL